MSGLLRTVGTLSFAKALNNNLRIGLSKMSSGHQKTNRLAQEKSPYLLQHKHNPVDWLPWGEEAFQKAKQLNRPVFLSIGYSTCHWCHVMAHESFEDEGIAKILNEKFVSIKLDREERPDIDKAYMSFVQALSGPRRLAVERLLDARQEALSSAARISRRKTRRHQTGFRSVLQLVSQKWTEDPAATSEHASHLVDVLKNAMKSKRFEGAISSEQAVAKCYKYLKSSFDHSHGGFGTAPKFPRALEPPLFGPLPRPQQKEARTGSWLLQMLTHTLDKINAGGIHDHVDSGFSRYSVDARWHVPHFEKMLYDNAQLLTMYSLAHILSPKSGFEEVIEDIIKYVNTRLKNDKFACFYSAEDADSLPTANSKKTVEGAFYVWTKEGDRENITLDELFNTTFNVRPNGNVPSQGDPHGELKGKNVLIRTRGYEELAAEFKMTVPQFKKALADCYAELRKEFLQMATKAFDFLAEKMRSSKDGSLFRSAYVDEKGEVSFHNSTTGFADDYACFIHAALDLYEATFEEKFLQLALDVQKTFDEKFFDAEGKSSSFRDHSAQDGAEPSANSVAALNLVRLSALLGDESFEKKADDVFHGAGELLSKNPHALPFMLVALERRQRPSVQIVIVGVTAEHEAVCREMLDVVKRAFIPHRSLLFVNKAKPGLVLQKNPHVRELIETIKEPTAMVCRGTECLMPALNVDELKERLQEI
ncbi:Thioredox-DsbH domain-containing protein [Aphelenchoides fujianensis]|nr:Thioredox-DsbH domain-containing protein [Aphelenchoides fujianensis]